MRFTVCEMGQSTIYGIGGLSGDKTIAKDIPKLSKAYLSAVNEERVLPFYVICSGYDKETGGFSLFVGSEKREGAPQSLTLEAGTYVKTTVKPKLGFLWGLAIGEAKREFYTKWLPASNYAARGLEYEYHTQSSVGMGASIEILFAVK